MILAHRLWLLCSRNRRGTSSTATRLVARPLEESRFERAVGLSNGGGGDDLRDEDDVFSSRSEGPPGAFFEQQLNQLEVR